MPQTSIHSIATSERHNTSIAESRYLSSGSGDPASLTTVGKMSMLVVGSWISSPAWRTPGHRRSPGTRIPPSQLFAFPPKMPKERQQGGLTLLRGYFSNHFQARNVPIWKKQVLPFHGFNENFTSNPGCVVVKKTWERGPTGCDTWPEWLGGHEQ